MNRAEKAAELKKRNNCCQAVLLAYSDILPLSEDELKAIGSGFGSGMGCMKATCGALCGASVAAGLLNKTGHLTPALTRQIVDKFEQLCGATICSELKGIKTGKPVCSCDDCVRNAVISLEEVINL